MATASGQWHDITLSAATNLTFAFTNRAAGRYIKVHVRNTSGTTRTIIAPGTLRSGTPGFVSSILTGDEVVYTFQFWGTTDALGEVTSYLVA